MRVQVYRNLHKNCYSVRCKKTRLVIMHVSEIALENVVFKVSNKGRERVLRERRKNVHAIVEGDLTRGFTTTGESINITYNPYKFSSFVTKESHIPVYKADNIRMNKDFSMEVFV